MKQQAVIVTLPPVVPRLVGRLSALSCWRPVTEMSLVTLKPSKSPLPSWKVRRLKVALLSPVTWKTVPKAVVEVP